MTDKQRTDKQAIQTFLKDQQIEDLVQLNALLKQMTGVVVEELLEAERDDHLGYTKYDTQNKHTSDRRNGHSQKQVHSAQGPLDVKIPRDRDGDFAPQLIKRYERDISQIEERVLSLYAKGMTVRDIQSHLEDIYGTSVSAGTISNMTERIQPLVEEWRNRPLSSVYSIVYIDGHGQHVRANGQVRTQKVYTVMGVDLWGQKDILGLWVAETENAKTWACVLTELRNRGVQDILLICSDDLPGIEDAIAAVFPDAVYQGCVVHVIRNSLKYVSYKDQKAFARDMKAIYTASTEEAALMALDALQQTWGARYPLAVQVWEKNWTRISTMFRFTQEIRRLIYTTNPIESYHRQVRKVTKNRSVFPDERSLLKLLYLVTQSVVKKWSMPLVHWNRILAELGVHFGQRVTDRL